MKIEDIKIRTELRPGDLGYVIHRHGVFYHEENNYGIRFEMYVAEAVKEFYMNYDPTKDCTWVCEDNDKIIGFMLLMHRPDYAAQLRFFYFDKEYRGIGFGNKLMQLFMDFLKKANYKSAYLWTTTEQTTAIALYEKFGFKLVEQKQSIVFDKDLIELRYEVWV